MLQERFGDVTFKGKPLTVFGVALLPGDMATEVTLNDKGFDGRKPLLASTAGFALGPFDAVTLQVFAVARMHDLAHTAFAMAEDGFAEVFLGNADIFAAFHVADTPAIDGGLWRRLWHAHQRAAHRAARHLRGR